MLRVLFERLIPAVVAAAMAAVVAWSQVPLDLVLVKGQPADVLLLGYVALLAALTIRPHSTRLHFATIPFTALVLSARISGFIDLAIARESWALTGAVLERAALLATVTFWHIAAVVHATGRDER